MKFQSFIIPWISLIFFLQTHSEEKKEYLQAVQRLKIVICLQTKNFYILYPEAHALTFMF